ncbi:MAG: DUF3047 domain-containing protein [Candidatus Omnitrophica bacterium]|nr:DUF3047 domain-containing protein [Candidatus Omnitrophota bacterium]
MKPKKIFSIILLSLAVVILIVYAANLPKLFKFDKKDALREWQEKIFKNRVLYTIEPTEGGGQLVANSKNACSGLIYNIRFDPKQYPLISWKWKVLKFPEKNYYASALLPKKSVSLWEKFLIAVGLKSQPPKPKSTNQAAAGKGSKSGWLERDDYAARIYVIFPSWIFSNIKAIEYVWSDDLPKGTVMTSPYFPNIKLIIVESGKKDNNDWVYEERNIYEDYKRAFGAGPSGVGAIAIMTDTDNTMSTAEALYTDIKVGYEK